LYDHNNVKLKKKILLNIRRICALKTKENENQLSNGNSSKTVTSAFWKKNTAPKRLKSNGKT